MQNPAPHLSADRLAFLDLETTGASSTSDRITEIGIVRVDGDALVDEWSSLVNPQMPIPPFIAELTGITDEMVADAPAFRALAEEVRDRLAGRLLVAHNARFDYGFLRAEFLRIGLPFAAPVLCTVKLSRRLTPHERRHNLDTLILRHGLPCIDRHRALGDARVLWDLLRQLRRERGEAPVAAAVQELLAAATPGGLPPGALDDAPEGPGAYVLFGEDGAVLQVGHAANLRSALHARLSRRKARVARLDWEPAAGELGALLRAAAWERELRPLEGGPAQDACALRVAADAGGLLGSEEPGFGAADDLYGPFRSRRDAHTALSRIARDNALCLSLLGVEPPGKCSLYPTTCRGACAGRERPLAHRLRALRVLERLRFPPWPYGGPVGLREGEGGLLVADGWRYLGSAADDAELEALLGCRGLPAFDVGVYRALRRALQSVPKSAPVLLRSA